MLRLLSCSPLPPLLRCVFVAWMASCPRCGWTMRGGAWRQAVDAWSQPLHAGCISPLCSKSRTQLLLRCTRVGACMRDAMHAKHALAGMCQLFAILGDADSRGHEPAPACVQMPGTAGVYAVYDSSGTLQYVGISRKVGRQAGRGRPALRSPGASPGLRLCLAASLDAVAVWALGRG